MIPSDSRDIAMQGNGIRFTIGLNFSLGHQSNTGSRGQIRRHVVPGFGIGYDTFAIRVSRLGSEYTIRTMNRDFITLTG